MPSVKYFDGLQWRPVSELNNFKIKASSTDTVSDYLRGKLSESDSIRWTLLNQGSGETLLPEIKPATSTICGGVKVGSGLSAAADGTLSIITGETSTLPYRGDRGAAAYAHSLSTHAPINAEQNVQSDWTVSDINSDAYIKNKPTIGTSASKDVPTTGDASATQVVLGSDNRLTNQRTPVAHTHQKTDIIGLDTTGSDRVPLSAYNANTILAATEDDTPLPVTIQEQTIVGRITGGSIAALTVAQVKTLLGITEAFIYKGVIDCSSNPNYPAGSVGDTYKVSVAGKIGGASGSVVEAGDTLYCCVAGSAGTQAAVGSNWDIVQMNADLNQYVLSSDSRLTNARTPVAHALIDTTNHPVTGLTAGNVLKALSPTTYGFAQLYPTDVGAQPLDTDLTSIAGLSGASGFLKKISDGVWSLDTNSYLTGITKAQIEAQLTGVISSHSHSNSAPAAHALIDSVNHTVSGLTAGHFLKALSATTYGFGPHGLTYTDVGAQPLDADLTAIASLAGNSGILKKTAADTWVLDTNTYLSAITKDQVEAVLTGTISTHSHDYQPQDADLTSIAALSGTTGLLRKTAANTWQLDTNTYITGTTTVNGHALSSNVTVTKSDVGLSNVPNVDTTVTIIPYTIDNGGSAITPGSKGYQMVPCNCTISGWTIVGDVSGSIVVDVKRATYANFPTTSSIAGSTLPTLSSAQKNQTSTLTGWTTTLAAGDFLEFYVNSATTITRAFIALNVVRT